ncbi:hypothetical protein BGW42_007446 [Actinomortierella wolfii]|nr:hypothetical protein BGW42_007446 [Actinomortierella wolfii]
MPPGEAPAVDELLVRNELQKRGVNASNEWIRQAIQHVCSTTAPDPFSSFGPTTTTTLHQQVADKVFSLYLLADFRTLAQKPLLPATKDTPHNEWLFGDKPTSRSVGGQDPSSLSNGGAILQLLHIQDISMSSLKILELCEALGVAGDQPGGFQVGKALPRGMCLLELTDGFRKISAMEMEPIHGIGIEMKLGVKILVKPVKVRHGMIQLSNANAKVIGGEVASMNRHPRRLVIMNQMKKNLGIPEDPLPLMPSTPPTVDGLQQPESTTRVISTTNNTSGYTSAMAANGGSSMVGNSNASGVFSFNTLPRTTGASSGWSTTTSAVRSSDSIPASSSRSATLSFKPGSVGSTRQNATAFSRSPKDPSTHDLQQQQTGWPSNTRKRPADDVADEVDGDIAGEIDSRAFQWDADDGWDGFEQESDWQQFNNDIDFDAFENDGAIEKTSRKDSARSSPPPSKPNVRVAQKSTTPTSDKKAMAIDQHGKKLDPSFMSTIPSTQRQRLSLKRPNRITRESSPVIKAGDTELIQPVKLEKNGDNSPFSSDGDVANEFERRLSVTRELHENHDMSMDEAEDPDTSMKTLKPNVQSADIFSPRNRRASSPPRKATTSTITDWMKSSNVKSERNRQASVVDLLSDNEAEHIIGTENNLTEDGLTPREREELERATRESLRLHQEYMAANAAETAAIAASTQATNIHHEALDGGTTMNQGNIEEFDIRGLDPNAFAGFYDHHDDQALHEAPTQVIPQSQGKQDRIYSSPTATPQLEQPSYRPHAEHHNHLNSDFGSKIAGPSSSSNSRRTSDKVQDGLVKVKQEKTLFEMDDTEDEDDLALLDSAGVNIKKEVIPLVPLSDVSTSVERGLEVRAKGRPDKMGKFSLTTLGASLMIFLVPPNIIDDSNGKASRNGGKLENDSEDSSNQSFRLEAQLESGVVERLLGMSSAEFALLVESNQHDIARGNVNALKQSLMDVDLVECRFQGMRKNLPVIREFTILARRSQ